MIRAWSIVIQLTIGTLALSEAVDLYCYKGNLSSIQIEAIEDSSNLITSNCIDIDLPTVFFASGFGTSNTSMVTLNYTSALLRAGNRNVVYFNWSKDAYTSNSTTVALDYLHAFTNVYKDGNRMADALEILVDNGLDMDNVELAGHSLGAHVMGAAGIRIKELKTAAKLLRAYDPARPLYAYNPTAVNPSCAKCVVAIHSDPGEYGLNMTVGRIDIFLNYGAYLNGTDAQPGCTTATLSNQMHLENLCSHIRAPLIGANAILNPVVDVDCYWIPRIGDQYNSNHYNMHELCQSLKASSSNAQSDIEWKYGLSKLIRNMHRTSTAPSPLNLVTTWLMWLIARCKQRLTKKKRPSLVHMIGLQRQDQMSARSKAGAKWLSKVKRGQVVPKDSTRLSVVHLSPLGSQLSFSNTTRIENVVDWEVIAKKYRALMRDEPEELVAKENEADTADDVSEIVPNNISAAPP